MAEKISSIYVQETYEAIRLFTDSFCRFSVTLQKFKNSQDPKKPEEKKVSPETLNLIDKVVDELKYYENHAFLRILAISESQKIDLKTIKEKREALKKRVPIENEVQDLTMEYHKILATKLTDIPFSSSTGQVNQLTGNL